MGKINIYQRVLKKTLFQALYNKKRKNILLNINQFINSILPFYENERITKIPRDSSKIRLKSLCWCTGNTSSYSRIFGLSRHSIRELSHSKMLPGITRQTW